MSVFDIDTSDIKLMEWFYEEIGKIEDEDILDFIDQFDPEKDPEKFLKDPEKTIDIFDEYFVRLYKHNDALTFRDLIEIYILIPAKAYSLKRIDIFKLFTDYLFELKKKLSEMNLEMTFNRKDMMMVLTFWSECLRALPNPGEIDGEEIMSIVKDVHQTISIYSEDDAIVFEKLRKLGKILLKILPALILRKIDARIYTYLREIYLWTLDGSDEFLERLEKEAPEFTNFIHYTVFTIRSYLGIPLL